MKRELLYNFDFASRIREVEAGYMEPDKGSVSVEVQKIPSDSLLKLIYQLDSRTNLPTGDIGYYVSDRANPQVKEYILTNLMRDVSSAANPVIPAGMDERLAMDLSRNQNESLEAYAERVNDFAKKNEYILQNAQSSLSSSESPVSAE